MPPKHVTLVAWQRADDLFIDIHQLTRRFLSEERFALTSQIRRAAYSVRANIVEGVARRSSGDRLRFLNIAEASLAEVGYCLLVAFRLGYIDNATHEDYDMRAKRAMAPLVGLIREG